MAHNFLFYEARAHTVCLTLISLYSALNSKVYVLPGWITSNPVYSFAFFSLEPQPPPMAASSRRMHTVQGMNGNGHQTVWFFLVLEKEVNN